ncbi:ATP-binding cassette sub-family A member 8-A [Amphibalanus amphitrite]|uniref:ATP-binding cassette sub-family A member 8-A n=1 Tax=Amphibalanus amphitrite TaxID=1232801 RepID=A0A6A4UUV0_AMPAM|nr:ATP-binding cassette sub-family A member 8-A [Amphibalanus amphitrite]
MTRCSVGALTALAVAAGLLAAASAEVTITDNGYSGLVVGISKDVPEDDGPQLIEAIKVRGAWNAREKCLGSTQHLKNKYGGGYMLEMKLGAGDDLSDRISEARRLVSEVFPAAILEESYGERLRYKIPQQDVGSLSKGFSEMEAAKQRLGMEEYSLSQTTLEQVFLRFAKEQEMGG